jgi:hypothetical protein
VNAQVELDEFAPRHAAREGIELRAVADFAEEFFRVVWACAEHADRPARRSQQPRHQVHQGRLARTVRADEARDAGRDGQVDAVDAEYLAVELRDALEDDHPFGVRFRCRHLITS